MSDVWNRLGGAGLLLALLALGVAPAGQAQPTVTDLRPESGTAGDTLRIYGAGFDATPSNNTVTIGGTSVTPDMGSSTVLYVEVPSGVSGPALVSVDDGSGSTDTAPELFVAVTGGTSRFETATDTLAGVADGEAEFGDVDGDGDLDLVVTGQTESSSALTALYLNEGNGFVRANQGIDDLYTGTVDLADFNGDGTLDLFVTGRTAASSTPLAQLYTNDGTGSFSQVTLSTITGVRSSAVDVGDVDGDGDVDLFVTGNNGAGPSSALYKNDLIESGTLGFTIPGLGLTGVQDGTVDFGDVDGDGDLDLFVTGSSSGSEEDGSGTPTATLYTNDGTGTSWGSTQDPFTAVLGGDADVGDVDGDGDLDLVVMGEDGNGAPATTLYTNDGTGGFSSTTANLPDLRDGTAAFGDTNADGAPDLLLTGIDPDDVIAGALFVNDGTGAFGLADSGVTPVQDGAAAPADHDGDGVLDLFLSGNDGASRTATLYSRPLRVTGVSPAPNDPSASTTRTVDLTFNTAVADMTGLADSIVVRGAQSGPIGGSVSGAGTEGLSYEPSQSFAPGEPVIVSVLGGIESTGGVPLDTARTFRFRAAASSGPGAFPLRSTVADTNVDGAISVAAGDINGDGIQDLVVAGLISNDVLWYAGDGTGGFGGGTEVASGVNYPRDVALTDLDGDGTLDVIVAEGAGESNSGDDAVRSYLNTAGDGSTFSTQDIETSGGSADDPRDIATGDFNGDGAPDVVAVSQDNNSIYAYRNDDASNGTYTEITIRDSGADDPRAVDVVDVDNNGAPDVVVGSVSDDNISWYPNDGRFNFGSETVINTNAANNPRDVDAADFDGDQEVEILAAQRGADGTAGDGAVAWYDSTASGWSRNVIATTDSVLTAVPADVDADADLDVVAGSVDGDSLVWYENQIDSGGGFAAGRAFGVKVDDVRDVAAADFDGDGGLDLAATAYAANSVFSYRNLSPLRVTGAVPPRNEVGVDTALADVRFTFNRALDGTSIEGSDVTLAGEQSGRLPVASVGVQSDTALVLEPGRSFHPGEEVTVSVLADSVADTLGVALDTTETSAFTTAASPGNGSFVEAGLGLTGVTGNTAPTSADWGDYNGDGAPDLVVTGVNGSGTKITTVYTNDGSGGLSALGSSTFRDVSDGEAEWIDYNGDGRLDLIVTGSSASSGNVTEVYRNEGGGNFTTVVSLANVYNSDVDGGDYNGDGAPDLALIGRTSGGSRVARIYRNDGGGSFTDIGAGLVGVSNGEVEWGDYDGDGDLDLVLTGTDGSAATTRVYRNDGDGTFSEASALSSDLMNVLNSSADWGDYDGDGDLDLVLAGSQDGTASGRTTTIYENNVASGNGFVALGAGLTNVSQGEVQWSDYDGDGDLDLSVTGIDDASTPAETAEIYRNEGGSFAAIGAGLTGVTLGAVDWTDLEGDGVLDVVVTGADTSGTATTTVYRQSVAFKVTDTSPSRNATSVDTALSAISVTFNRTPDGGAMDPDDIRVVGRQTGPVPEADGTVGVNSNTITYEPGRRLQPGEDVTVSLRADSIRATDGTPLRRTYAFQFVGATQNVSPSFPVDSVLSDTASFVSSVAAADLDGSGRPDALVAVDGDGTVGWFPNNQPDGFSDLQIIDDTFTSPFDAIAADLDGDGDLDVVGSEASFNELRWYENDGTSTPFSSAGGTSISTGNVQDITAADLDGDGDPDLVAGLDAEGAVVWHENQLDEGTGFAPADSIGPAPDADAITVADVDSNGTLDVISVSSGNNSVAWHKNTAGDGSTWSTTTITTNVSGDDDGVSNEVAATDLDGDGDVDVLVSSDVDDALTWYENTDGSGTSWAANTITTSASDASDIAPADVDGDGDPDVVYSANLNDRVAWYENTDGSGSFSSSDTPITTSTSSPRTVAPADFDGSGTLGVLTGGGSKISVHPNTTIAPQVMTEAARDTTVSSVTAEAKVNPGGQETSVTFQYGRDTTFGTDSTVTASQSPITGDDTLAVSGTISGLNSETTYNYRVQASNSLGTTTGEIRTVTTEVTSPQATVEPATTITTTQMTFNGVVNPGGDTTDVSIDFGRDGGGALTALFVDGLKTGLTTDSLVSIPSPDTLRPSTAYRHRIRARNSVGADTSSFATATTNNVPPVASSDTAATDEDQSISVPILANDSDVGTAGLGGALDSSAVAVVDSASIGTATADTSTGEIIYAPAPDSNGTDSFTYVAVDDSSATDTAAVSITINPVNDAPVASGDTATTDGGRSVSIRVLANDTDVEGRLDTSSVAVVEGPSRGSASVDGGQINYTADADYAGKDSLRYQVSDRVGSGQETVKADTTSVLVRVSEVALATVRDTVQNGSAQVEQTRTATDVVLENRGNIRLTNLQATLIGDAASDFEVKDDLGGTSLASGERQSVRLSFAPSALGRRAARLVVTSAEGARDTTRIVGRGVTLSVETEMPTRGEGFQLDLVVSGGLAAPDTKRLQVRRGGTSAYQSIPMRTTDSSGTDVRLTGEVPDSLVTPRGVEYYAVLSTGPDTLTVPVGKQTRVRRRPRHLPVAFGELVAPVDLRPQRYRMVSVPARVEGGVKAGLRAAYGAYDPSQWRLERWGPAGSRSGTDQGTYRGYPQVDSLRPGEGFWLVTAEGTAPVLPAGRTVAADTAWRVPLEAGWNQVGAPFGFAVPWDTIRAASGLSGAQVDGPIAYRDSTYRRVARLEPWTGYFVFSAEPDTLAVPPVGATAEKAPPAERKRATDSGPAPSPPADSAQYRLRVEALGRSGRAEAVLGLRTGAEVGRDRYDRAQVPPIGAGPRLEALEPVADRMVGHAYSARPLAGNASPRKGQSWTLQLRRPGGPEEGGARAFRLRLRSEGDLPKGWGRYLLDLRREQRIAPGASLHLKPGESRRLKVIVGTEAYARENSENISLSSLDTSLRGSYPNPFEERTTIEYVLADEQRVTVEVYNVLGQRVRTLADGVKEAGVHRLTWAGVNRYGTPVGSGVYFYRLRAGDLTETRKMVLVR